MSSIADGGGEKARPEISSGVDSIAFIQSRCQVMLKNSVEGKEDVPVWRPNAAPIPKIIMNRASGARPPGGGVFFRSLIARTAIIKIRVPRNSLKKAETFETYGSWGTGKFQNTRRHEWVIALTAYVENSPAVSSVRTPLPPSTMSMAL